MTNLVKFRLTNLYAGNARKRSAYSVSPANVISLSAGNIAMPRSIDALSTIRVSIRLSLQRKILK